jgi:dTDP-4-amino-4,6-dideoxygalactose transaminase
MKKPARRKIKLFEPISGTKEKLAIQKVLTSGFWASGAGKGQVEIFEKKFQNYINAKDCVAVNSGTAALHLALSLADVKDKEVVLPSLSFVSTAHCAVYNGAKPILLMWIQKHCVLIQN